MIRYKFSPGVFCKGRSSIKYSYRFKKNYNLKSHFIKGFKVRGWLTELKCVGLYVDGLICCLIKYLDFLLSSPISLIAFWSVEKVD